VRKTCRWGNLGTDPPFSKSGGIPLAILEDYGHCNHKPLIQNKFRAERLEPSELPAIFVPVGASRGPRGSVPQERKAGSNYTDPETNIVLEVIWFGV
jgi:hypothetical protein